MSTTPQRLGKYELQTLLGRGSTGEVWQGYDRQAHRTVAIKLLHPDLLQSDPNFISSFMTDWQAITALHHANIVQVYEANISRPSASGSSSSTTPYIVMDYIDGYANLADNIRRTSRAGHFPSVTDIVYLFTSLASAIDYTHAQNIVHGNIKPTNILLNSANTQHITSGEPMFTDFGIANLPGNKSSSSSFYLSPEQAKGQPAEPSSDIYSLGVILYEICTGVLPFHGESHIAIMMHHINTLPTPPILINPYIPTPLSEVILRALAKDPTTRFSTASSLAEAIAESCSVEHSSPPTLNKAQASTDDSHYYPTSGPLRPPFTQSQPTGNMPPILGVSQPLPDISAKYATVDTKNNQQSHLISTGQHGTSPHLDTQPSPSLSPSRTQTSAKIPIPTPSTKIAIPPTASSTRSEPTFKFRPSNFLSPVATMIVFLLLLLVVVGALAASLLLRTSSQQANTSSIVGHVFFQDDALGHNDLLRIEIHNVPTPPQGQRYYAWYQNAARQTFPLGPLTPDNDSATLLYKGDAHHTNLLSTLQTVFVTLENEGNNLPTTPSNKAKVYQASFAAASLPYIQHILYMQPNFPVHSGLITGLLATIKSINDKAGSIVDTLQSTHDYPLARRQAIRIIELIDGSQYAQSSGDLPSDQPALLFVPVGLLSSPTQPGYLDALTAEVDKVKQTAGNNTALHQHAQNVSNALIDLQDWVQQMRNYDVQLLKVPNLSAPTAMNPALQLQQFAEDAYTGRTIPPNSAPLPILNSAGAYQAFVEAQYMATLDIKKV